MREETGAQRPAAVALSYVAKHSSAKHAHLGPVLHALGVIDRNIALAALAHETDELGGNILNVLRAIT